MPMRGLNTPWNTPLETSTWKECKEKFYSTSLRFIDPGSSRFPDRLSYPIRSYLVNNHTHLVWSRHFDLTFLETSESRPNSNSQRRINAGSACGPDAFFLSNLYLNSESESRFRLKADAIHSEIVKVEFNIDRSLRYVFHFQFYALSRI